MEYKLSFTKEPINIGDIVVYLHNEKTGSSTIRKCKFIGQVEEFKTKTINIRRLSKPDTFVTPDECEDFGINKVYPEDIVDIIISKHNIFTTENTIKKDFMTDWIPITYRETTEEERKENCWSEDITHTFTCPLPDDGDEILISRNNGKWVDLVVFCNDDYGVGDEDGNDWIYEVEAWMPAPKGYVKPDKYRHATKGE